MNYGLPTSVVINEKTHPIRSDYRAILDIMSALNDDDLTNSEKGYITLAIFYEDFDEMNESEYEDAISECFKFIDMGRKSGGHSPKLVDWDKDIPLIIAPVNRVAGCEIRSLPYLHWWTFLSYYYEIGECLFAQVVQTRNKLAKGKALDKFDKEWYMNNKDLVDFETKYTSSEEDILKQWGGA